MSPRCEHHSLAYKDAIVLSPHKLVGGPGTPGVLVVRRELLANRVPDVVGGGTVALRQRRPSTGTSTTPSTARRRGTPAIVESIRAGLVFQLKHAVGVEVIRAHEDDFWRRAVARWRENPSLELLGNLEADRLSIVSLRRRAARRSLSAPQLRRRAAERPVRHPGARRLLLRRAVRAPPARDRPRALARVRARGARAAARASSPAGRASRSTTSSRRRCSSTSSRRSTWSPPRAGACCPTIASTPSPGSGGTVTGRSSRRCG